MRSPNQTNSARWQTSQLTKSLVLVLACLAIWFAPTTHTFCQILDFQLYKILNQSLLLSHAWQVLWGYLNHPNETWMNILLMVAINIVGIFSVPKSKRLRATVLMLYSWIFFQFVLLFTHKVFCDWIEVQRDSPSIIFTPWVILSQALDIPNIKVYSHSSFPAGHVLVLIFWYKFITLYAKDWVKNLALLTVVMFTLPRMISGAHWASDVIFTIAYSNLCFSIAVGVPFFFNRVTNIENFLFAFFGKSKRIIGTA